MSEEMSQLHKKPSESVTAAWRESLDRHNNIKNPPIVHLSDRIKGMNLESATALARLEGKTLYDIDTSKKQMNHTSDVPIVIRDGKVYPCTWW